jgi:hypothetical protein
MSDRVQGPDPYLIAALILLTLALLFVGWWPAAAVVFVLLFAVAA